MDQVKVKYSCNTLPHFWRSLYIILTLSSMSMAGMIALGIPTVFIVPLYFLIMAFLLALFLKKSLFEFTDSELMETLSPYLGFIKTKPVIKKFSWSQIKSFLLDENWNRSMGMQKHLKINFPGYQMTLWEGKYDFEKKAFEELSQYFLTRAPQTLKKKSFYDKPLAKLLALFFVVMTGVFIVLTALGIMTPSGLLKLAFVIVPGTLLFLNRVFKKPTK